MFTRTSYVHDSFVSWFHSYFISFIPSSYTWREVLFSFCYVVHSFCSFCVYKIKNMNTININNTSAARWRITFSFTIELFYFFFFFPFLPTMSLDLTLWGLAINSRGYIMPLRLVYMPLTLYQQTQYLYYNIWQTTRFAFGGVRTGGDAR